MRRVQLVLLFAIAMMAVLFPAMAGAADLPATPSNYQSVYNGAAGGDNVILAAGTYGGLTGADKSSTVTVKPASGATVNMAGATFVADDNTTIQGINFTGSICVMSTSLNVNFDNIRMVNVGQSCNEGRLGYIQGSTGTVSNSFFSGEPSCSNQSDGIMLSGGGGQDARVSIIGNEFSNLIQQSGCPHVDAVQYYGGTSPRVEDNFVHNVSTGIEGYDSNGDVDVFKNNVLDTGSSYVTSVAYSSNTNGVFSHNVLVDGRLDLGPKPNSGNPNPSGNTIKDNVADQLNAPGSSNTITNNLTSGQVTFVGGSGRCGYALAPGSAGKGAATDGTDIGLNNCGGSPPPTVECNDGINNDPTEDALIDYPNDPGCSSATDTTESGNPPPPPTDHQPVARFTASPEPSAVGQQVTFDGTASTCEDTPCTYVWHDGAPDGSGNWPLGPNGATSTFTFQQEHPASAPVMATLVVTDADGDTDTVEHDHVVTNTPPPGDTTPPDTTITNAPSDSTSTSASVSFTGTDNVGVDHFDCRIDGGTYSVCTSPKSYTGLSVGSHTVDVKAVDAAGNADPTAASATWSVLPPADTTAPDTTITAQPSNPTTSTSASFSFTGTDNVGVTGFECKLDAGTYASCTSPKDYTSLATGSHTFSVRAKDAAGNVDASPASYTWTINPPSTVTPPSFVAEAETAWTRTTTASRSVTLAVRPGDVLVAYAGSEDSPNTVSISGSPAAVNTNAWTLKQSFVSSGYSPAYVWTTTIGGSSNFNATITFTRAGGTSNIAYGGDVLQFRGSTGIGASNKSNGTGTPSTTLTTTKDNSAIVKFSTDWSAQNGAARNSLTSGVGAFTEKTYDNPAGAFTVYGGYHANVGSIGSKTVGYTAPTGQKWSQVAVEVKGT